MDRNEAIDRIRRALKARSGKAWSVTGGRGTAWGWIKIDAPPKRQRYDFEGNKIPEGDRYGYMGLEDRAELAKLLGRRDGDLIHPQGESIPAANDYYRWFVDLAEGRTPAGDQPRPYWD